MLPSLLILSLILWSYCLICLKFCFFFTTEFVGMLVEIRWYLIWLDMPWDNSCLLVGRSVLSWGSFLPSSVNILSLLSLFGFYVWGLYCLVGLLAIYYDYLMGSEDMILLVMGFNMVVSGKWNSLLYYLVVDVKVYWKVFWLLVMNWHLVFELPFMVFSYFLHLVWVESHVDLLFVGRRMKYKYCCASIHASFNLWLVWRWFDSVCKLHHSLSLFIMASFAILILFDIMVRWVTLWFLMFNKYLILIPPYMVSPCFLTYGFSVGYENLSLGISCLDLSSLLSSLNSQSYKFYVDFSVWFGKIPPCWICYDLMVNYWLVNMNCWIMYWFMEMSWFFCLSFEIIKAYMVLSSTKSFSCFLYFNIIYLDPVNRSHWVVLFWSFESDFEPPLFCCSWPYEMSFSIMIFGWLAWGYACGPIIFGYLNSAVYLTCWPLDWCIYFDVMVCWVLGSKSIIIKSSFWLHMMGWIAHTLYFLYFPPSCCGQSVFYLIITYVIGWLSGLIFYSDGSLLSLAFCVGSSLPLEAYVINGHIILYNIPNKYWWGPLIVLHISLVDSYLVFNLGLMIDLIFWTYGSVPNIMLDLHPFVFCWINILFWHFWHCWFILLYLKCRFLFSSPVLQIGSCSLEDPLGLICFCNLFCYCNFFSFCFYVTLRVVGIRIGWVLIFLSGLGCALVLVGCLILRCVSCICVTRFLINA